MLQFPSHKNCFENNVIKKEISMSKKKIIFVEPAIQVGYFSIFFRVLCLLFEFHIWWLDFSSHVFCSKMAHELKVCEQFRTFTGLPMNWSAGISLYLQFSPSNFQTCCSQIAENWIGSFLGRNEIKLSKLARGPPIARRGPVILYLKICQFPLSKSLQKVPTNSFFLYLVWVCKTRTGLGTETMCFVT
jgi:hypothetical protein